MERLPVVVVPAPVVLVVVPVVVEERERNPLVLPDKLRIQQANAFVSVTTRWMRPGNASSNGRSVLPDIILTIPVIASNGLSIVLRDTISTDSFASKRRINIGRNPEFMDSIRVRGINIRVGDNAVRIRRGKQRGNPV